MSEFKKMKQKKTFTKITGICECGYEKNFDAFKDLDRSDFHRFIHPFTCPECNSVYYSLAKNEKALRNRSKKINLILICGIIGLSVLTYSIINIGISKDNFEPTFYETKDPKDMTKKELEQYLEWKLKQEQKDSDNQKINNDG